MLRIEFSDSDGGNGVRLTAAFRIAATFAGALEYRVPNLQFRVRDNNTWKDKTMTDRRTFLATGIAFLGVGIGGCAGSGAEGGWVTLVDGTHPSSIDGWTQIGEGNWSFVDGTLQGKNGKSGFLVSKNSYTDFELRAEFWADEDANSGIFLRCQDRNKVGSATAYEVNIFDKRPDPSYGTGAIVGVAKVAQPAPKAANRWNTYEITARGERMVVVLNGQQTADGHDDKRRSGPIALQSAAGTIRFRKVQIRTM
jgi:3-keto-disaccharide hydrolase